MGEQQEWKVKPFERQPPWGLFELRFLEGLPFRFTNMEMQHSQNLNSETKAECVDDQVKWLFTEKEGFCF